MIFFNQYFYDNRPLAMPIGLLSLASYMNSRGVKSRIFEAMNRKNVIKIVKRYKPDCVGISCQFTPHYAEVLEIAEAIKFVDKNIHVIIGGNHASTLTKLDKNIDCAIKGEGELALYDAYTKRLKGIVGPYPLIKDIDSLPNIDYSLIYMKDYISGKSKYHMRHPIAGVVTSRGCPNDCIYCTVKGVWGRSWRGKEASRVVDDIQNLMAIGIKEINFLDDNASVNKARWHKIMDEIIDRKLNIKWTMPNGIAHWTLDKPLLTKMKKAGCYRITFGIESANTKIREFIRKKYPLPLDLIRHANKIGIWTMTTNILGFPGETKEQMEETFNFAKKSGVDFAAFFILDYYPSADIAKYPKDLELANKMQKIFYKKFFVHKLFTSWKIMYKIRNIEDFLFVLRMISVGINILINSLRIKSDKEKRTGIKNNKTSKELFYD